MMKTLDELLKWGTGILTQSNVMNAELDAWYFLEHVFSISRIDFLLDRNRALTEDDNTKVEQYKNFIQKRSEGYPLQQLIGYTEFMGLRFEVNEHVLTPRQDTEVLVETALSLMKPESDVLDMCTGSGCIILSIAKLGSVKSAAGVDISVEALKVAQRNRDNLSLESVKLIHSNLFENVTGTYDMITSNPPYIPTADIEGLMTEVKDHEPMLALDGSEDGLLFYRKIVKDARCFLKDNGILIMEIGYNQAEDVSKLLEDAGYTDIHVKKDLAGLDRVVYAYKA